jgi:flagellar biosynthesis chaperone FliJ
MENVENINVEIAINQYKKHLEAVKKYQKENPEKMSEKAKKYYANKKLSNPEAYIKMLEVKKEQYRLKKLKNNLV